MFCRCREHSDNRKILEGLTNAIGGEGGLCGRRNEKGVGLLDVALIDPAPLQQALLTAARLSTQGGDAAALLREAAATMVLLRTAVANRQWLDVVHLCNDNDTYNETYNETYNDTYNETYNNGGNTSVVRQEYARARAEAEDHLIVSACHLACSQGGMTGVVGKVVTSTVDTASLNAAIAQAETWTCRSATSQQSLATCVLLKALRTSVTAGGEWDVVRRVLQEAREAAGAGESRFLLFFRRIDLLTDKVQPAF